MDLEPRYDGQRRIDYLVVNINEVCMNMFGCIVNPELPGELSKIIRDEMSLRALMKGLDTDSKVPVPPDSGFLYTVGTTSVYITIQRLSSQLIRLVCVDLTELMDVMQRSDDLYAHIQSPVAILSETGEILNVNGCRGIRSHSCLRRTSWITCILLTETVRGPVCCSARVGQSPA